MRFAKKYLFICMILASFALCAVSAKDKKGGALPAFDKADVYVFDAEAELSKKYKDNIRFVSKTRDMGLVFNVYAYNEKTETWFLFGTAFLKNYDDTDMVDTVRKVKVKNYRYFAIEIEGNANGYRYDLSVSHNDIYITVRNK